MSMTDRTFIEMAEILAKESSCIMYKVGCLIVKDNRIISMGYNGTPAGFINCCDKHSHIQPRFGPQAYTQEEKEEHHRFSEKFEIHAEINAILYAAKNGIKIDESTLYSTLQPCNNCLKNICQSGIKRIVYKDKYSRSEYDEDVLQMIKTSDLKIEQLR